MTITSPSQSNNEFYNMEKTKKMQIKKMSCVVSPSITHGF